MGAGGPAADPLRRGSPPGGSASRSVGLSMGAFNVLISSIIALALLADDDAAGAAAGRGDGGPDERPAPPPEATRAGR